MLIRRALPLFICGVSSLAQTDICVLDDNEILLLVQEDERLLSLKDTEPQVIADVIAFAVYNKVRVVSLNLAPLATATFPAITMVCTRPTFYKITDTAQMSAAVQQGTYSENETLALRYIPVLPGRQSLWVRSVKNRL